MCRVWVASEIPTVNEIDTGTCHLSAWSTSSMLFEVCYPTHFVIPREAVVVAACGASKHTYLFSNNVARLNLVEVRLRLIR